MLGFMIKQMKENEESHILNFDNQELTYWFKSHYCACNNTFYLINSYTVILPLFSQKYIVINLNNAVSINKFGVLFTV